MSCDGRIAVVYTWIVPGLPSEIGQRLIGISYRSKCRHSADVIHSTIVIRGACAVGDDDRLDVVECRVETRYDFPIALPWYCQSVRESLVPMRAV